MPKITPEEYKKIVKGLEIEFICLKDFKGIVNRAYIPELLKVAMQSSYDFKILKGNSVEVYSHFKIRANNPKLKSSFLEISLTYCIVLSTKSKFTKDFFEVYSKVSLPVFIWPFVREFVNNITSRMNMPPLNLPLLKEIPKQKIARIRKRKTTSK